MDLKKRLKNKVWLMTFIGAIYMLLEALGIHIAENIPQVVEIIIMMLVMLGVVIDPTTEGVKDGGQQ